MKQYRLESLFLLACHWWMVRRWLPEVSRRRRLLTVKLERPLEGPNRVCSSDKESITLVKEDCFRAEAKCSFCRTVTPALSPCAKGSEL